MPNGKEDRRKRLKTNGNGNSMGDIKGNDNNNNNNNNNNHGITNDDSSDNNKYSNNKNRNERTLMERGSPSNRSMRVGGKKSDIKDGNSVLSLLKLKQDKLSDSSQDYRPVYLCIPPIVCRRLQLRRGNQKQGERLTAKYRRWYPELVRLQPLEEQHTPELYTIFKNYGSICHDMLLKIWVSHPTVDQMRLEKTCMIGVFAGHEFNTGALARKLSMFHTDFPTLFEYLRDQRAAVAEQMNARYFHHTNIEEWYDPQTLTRELLLKHLNIYVKKYYDIQQQLI